LLLRRKPRSWGAIDNERRGGAVELLLRRKPRSWGAIGNERSGGAVELLLRRKPRSWGAIGNERSGGAVELLLRWKPRSWGAVGAERAVVENWITNSLIDRACNGEYDEQSKQREHAYNRNFFHSLMPPGEENKEEQSEGKEDR
jgi:hypothetical protein